MRNQKQSGGISTGKGKKSSNLCISGQDPSWELQLDPARGLQSGSRVVHNKATERNLGFCALASSVTAEAHPRAMKTPRHFCSNSSKVILRRRVICEGHWKQKPWSSKECTEMVKGIRENLGGALQCLPHPYKRLLSLCQCQGSISFMQCTIQLSQYPYE